MSRESVGGAPAQVRLNYEQGDSRQTPALVHIIIPASGECYENSQQTGERNSE